MERSIFYAATFAAVKAAVAGEPLPYKGRDVDILPGDSVGAWIRGDCVYDRNTNWNVRVREIDYGFMLGWMFPEWKARYQGQPASRRMAPCVYREDIHIALEELGLIRDGDEVERR